MNTVTITVNDKTKSLRFSETLVAGSVYAVTVRGGADVCGTGASLGIKVGSTTVAFATLTNGAGTLSLLTQEMASVTQGMRDGTRIPAVAAIRDNTTNANQIVGVGKADILFAGSEWMETSALVQVSVKGDKGDDGDSAYQVAVRNGYTGTEAEWVAWMQNAATVAADAASTAATASDNAATALERANAALAAAYTDARAGAVFDTKWGAAKAAVQTVSAAWTFTASPNVPTAGTATNDTTAASAEFVHAVVATVEPRYPLVAKTLSSNAVTLDDRAINTLALGSASTATINFPAAVTGKARDFWLVVTASGATARAVSLVGGTCYGENATTFELNEGAAFPNVFVFTEIQSGVFIVRRRVFTVQSNTIS